MIKFGKVQAYDEQTGVATIVYERPDACEKCGACGTKKHEGSIGLKADCKVGDWVRVELPDAQFLRATAIAYVIPLCCFLAGLLLGYFLSGKRDLFALVGGMGGLAIGVLGISLADKRIRTKPEWSPRVTAVYSDKPDMEELGCGGAGAH